MNGSLHDARHSQVAFGVSYGVVDWLATGSMIALTIGLFFVIGLWGLLTMLAYVLGGVSFWAYERKSFK